MTEGARVHSILTDAELDEALAALSPALPFDDSVAERIRAKAGLAPGLAVGLAAGRVKERGSRKRWFAAAAAVVVLAVGAVVVRPLLGGDFTPVASAAAARDLERAATFAEGQGEPGPGEFLYVEYREASLGSASTRTGQLLTAVFDTESQVWIPADRAQEWLKRTTPHGPQRWLVGSAELARTEGDGGLLDPTTLAPSEVRAPCGDFPGWNGEVSAHLVEGDCSADSGDWGHVTPQFLTGLPTDPQRLYARMLADAGNRPEEVVSLAATVLRSGQADRELRTALLRALMLVPGLAVTDGEANLDGRVGVGLGSVQGEVRAEIVVDPATGRYLGDRDVLLKPGIGMWQGIPAGTVISSSAVETAVVPGIGVGPR
ncbi:CU044_5270 family protein [Amycolatopsis rhabdoformis]|uniref:CU044_5270 family protein n=1 Tax=Amycolatopsis rhabdoformis TaxID=1448059 RepID=A0ABZ1I2U0_9PSEU|nr:CU044_5270 family protein [Amycolatopsis rhabdoformis]WSE28702.1 CU044_5270 family protein [Amycolatopsis rhabdoformis]